MTSPERAAAARRLVDRTTEAQGLPRRVSDPEVLRRIARVFTRPKEKARTERKPAA